MLKAVLISLVSGGVATSLAEYFLHYNLADLVKDKIVGLFRSIGGIFKKSPPAGGASGKV